MKIKCKKCNLIFENRPYINGKRFSGGKRKFCFECSPYISSSDKIKESKERLLITKESIRDGRFGICKFCGIEMNIVKVRKQTSCSACHKNLQKIKKKMFAVSYRGGKCECCGWAPEDFSEFCCFDFHHINPTEKEFELNDMYSKGVNSIVKELDKCIMLCAICHRKKHKTDYPESLIIKAYSEICNLKSVI